MLETDLTRVPENVTVLMVVHPKKLPPQTLYAIDQFALGGGKVFALVDASPKSRCRTAAIQRWRRSSE